MRGLANDLTIGERIAWYRRRRGLSQEVLAGLVGRSADWLGKIENGRVELDRLSILRRLAEVLDVALGDLIAEPLLMEWTQDSGQRTVPALRAVLMDYHLSTGGSSDRDEDPVSPDAIRAGLEQAWSAYQESRFGFATSKLTTLIPQAEAGLGSAGDGAAARVLAGRLALAYQAAASVLTKLGEADLAWSASDRGVRLARRSENDAVMGSLLRSVAHSLLSVGAYEESVRVTSDSVDLLGARAAKAGPGLLSVYGTSLLVGAMAAARSEDRHTTLEFMAEADRAAARLGSDQNKYWTAFGPTNVAIHRVSTAMELGDVQFAVELGPALDASALPRERQVRHQLEVARALSAVNRRDEALRQVLKAEEIAPEQVQYHFLSRHLVQSWIRTQRGKPSIELAELGRRLHVA